jgi:hypothetical protein
VEQKHALSSRCRAFGSHGNKNTKYPPIAKKVERMMPAGMPRADTYSNFRPLLLAFFAR